MGAEGGRSSGTREKMLRPENLEPMAGEMAPANLPTGDLMQGSGAAGGEQSMQEPSDVSLVAGDGQGMTSAASGVGLPSVMEAEDRRVQRGAEELLVLLAERREFLACARRNAADVSERSGRIRRELEAEVLECRSSLQEYPNLTPPATLGELRERNRTRVRLQALVKDVHAALEGIAGAWKEPADTLQAAKSNILQRFDSLLECLQRMREETAQRFKLQAEEVQIGQAQSQETLREVSPFVEQVDAFVRCLAKELEAESGAKRDASASIRAKLQEEEARFVRANDTPSKNPIFKRVQAEIEALEAGERARAEEDAAEAAMLRSWEELCGRLPSSRPILALAPALPQEADVHRTKWWGRWQLW